MLDLFADEDSLDRAIVRGLRQRGIDVTTAAETGRLGLTDEEQLQFAAEQGRALYTRNLPHFTRIHTEWMQAGRHHAGVIVVRARSMPVGAQIRALTRLASTFSSEEMTDRIEFLSNWLD